MIEIHNVKLMKVVLLLFVCAALTGLSSPAQASTPADVNVTVEGEPLVMPVPPVIVNDRTLIGVRFVGEAVGGSVEWNQEKRQALVTRGSDSVLLTLGSTEALVNGQPVIMPVAAQLVEERTMVPLRFIAEALGGQVEWNPETRTANILRKAVAITAMTYSRDIGISRVRLTFSEPLLRAEAVKTEQTAALDLYPAVIAVPDPARVVFDTLLRVIHLQADGRTVRFEAFPWVETVWTHQLSADGQELIIQFPHMVTGLLFQQQGRTPLVSVAANGRLNYTTQQLTNPDRLVLDLAGAKLGPNVPAQLKTGTSYLQEIQVSAHPDDPGSTRVVLTMPSAMPHEIISTELGLQIRFVPVIESVKVQPLEGKTRLTIAGSAGLDPKVTVLQQQRQIRIEIPQARSALAESLIPIEDGTITSISLSPGANRDSTLITVNLPYYLGHTLVSKPGDSAVQIDIVTSPVFGKRIWLDAGHGKVPGGKDDPGAIGRNTGLKEKDLNLKVTLEVQRLLQAAGATVLMTRTGDEGPDFTDRAALVNAMKPAVDLFVSVHHNSAVSTATRGTETYHWTTHAKSQKAAEVLHAAILKGLGFPDRRVRLEKFNVIRETLVPAVLLELGYLSHPEEELLLALPTYPAKAANAIRNGIFDYFWQEIRGTGAN